MMANETVLYFLQDMYCYELTAKVVSLSENNNIVIVDRTIFYPQGGGQPSDIGKITGSPGQQFIVREVRSKDGQVLHQGHFDNCQPFEVGQVVTLTLDRDKRELFSRLHTAGHLVDVALSNIGYGLDRLVPGKGYHWPDGAYVEYTGKITENKEVVRVRLEEETNRLISEGGAVKVTVVTSPEEAKVLCGGTHCPPLDYLPSGRPIRIVTVVGTIGCPCGGTHVRDIRELREIRIRGLRTRKDKLIVRYDVV